ncbi:hypothetical protein EVAR_31503_1 [Eumeta japonica]|uniref:Uncharacterized protein n=1 Tax=Eumeta variegata TaxID=151549 RepID=A0A4C1YXG2_EUMVA|nr:hypothetical protein EVAR_31503_1 [Eumeta japonica]
MAMAKGMIKRIGYDIKIGSGRAAPADAAGAGPRRAAARAATDGTPSLSATFIHNQSHIYEVYQIAKDTRKRARVSPRLDRVAFPQTHRLYKTFSAIPIQESRIAHVRGRSPRRHRLK